MQGITVNFTYDFKHHSNEYSAEADSWERASSVCFPLIQTRTGCEGPQLDSWSSEAFQAEVPSQSLKVIIWALAVSVITENMFIMYVR